MKTKKRDVLILAFLAVLFWGAQARLGEADKAPEKVDLEKYVKVIERGLEYLKSIQNEDGSWGRDPRTQKARGHIGLTGLSIYAFAVSPKKYPLDKHPFLKKAVDWLLQHQQADGGIYHKGEGLENYLTSVAAMALLTVDGSKYKSQLEKAQKAVRGWQLVEQAGFDKNKHPHSFGGFGYGSTQNSDLSNTQFSLELLKRLEEAGYGKNTEVYQNALTFLHRCQDNPEVNELPWAKTGEKSGGAIYRPNFSQANDGKPITTRQGKSWRAYGSMTYAMIKAYIYCDLKPGSPELNAALEWITNNYTLDENPGMGLAGLYYYYHTMAKALDVYYRALSAQEKKKAWLLKDKDGVQHDWAVELLEKMSALQDKDKGSWVNKASRWYEALPELCTAYAVATMSTAHDFLQWRQAP